MGSKLARRIDEDIEEQITKKSGDFGIIQGDIQKILRNINKGIPPQQILNSAINGEDLGITIPVQEKHLPQKTRFHSIKNTFHRHQKKLEPVLKKWFQKTASTNHTNNIISDTLSFFLQLFFVFPADQ